MIVNDRAGGTSHGSGNAPAHLFSAATVLTPSELLDRLAEKGVVVDDSEIGTRLVSVVGYRHIVRYVPALKRVYAKPTVSLLANAVHSDLLFQNLLLLYSSQFERAFKTRLSSALAAEFGARAHALPWIFKREKDCDSFRQSYWGELVRKARGGSRYAAKLAGEGDNLSVWSACEYASFGTVSKLFSNLAPCNAKRAVISHYGFAAAVLESWLEALVFLRNEASHGGVLYGRVLERQPKSIDELNGLDNKYSFYQFILLIGLLSRDFPEVIKSAYDDLERVLSFCDSYAAFGVPANWAEVYESALNGKARERHPGL